MSDSFANELTRNLSMARGSLSGAGLYVIVDDCSPRQQGLGHLNLLALLTSVPTFIHNRPEPSSETRYL